MRCVEGSPGFPTNHPRCRIQRLPHPTADASRSVVGAHDCDVGFQTSEHAGDGMVLWSCTVRTQERDFSPALGDPSQTEIGASSETLRSSVRSLDGHAAVTGEHGDAGCRSFI